MKYKNILVTGAMGFIGFNAVRRWKKQYPECNFFGTHANTYADKFMHEDKDKWIHENKFSNIIIDLGDQIECLVLSEWVKKNEIDAIVHFGAESHVDNAIKTPRKFFRSNVLGTANILDIARDNDIRIHIVSTDEVYGETFPNSSVFTTPEQMLLKPSSPYSSSKASADLIALSYFHTYGTKVTISRCTNNAGEYQHFEKLIGTTISRALKNEKIPVYGEGLQRRHWIHVDDHNAAVMDILENKELGKIYNIAPPRENWIVNIDLIKMILSCMNKPTSLIEHVSDRLGHDTSYFLNPSVDIKAKMVDEFMPSIVEWYARKLK